MKKNLIYFLIAVCTLATNFLFAQKITKEGKATFTFSYPDENKFDPKLLSQRENKGATVYFKNGKSRVEIETEDNRFVYLIDSKKKENILLRDSTAFKHTFEDIRASMKKFYGDTTAEITNETKIIAGQKCVKAIYRYPVSDEKPIRKLIIWFTRDIAASNWNFDFKGIDGFIMEYDFLDIMYPGGEPVDFTEIMTCISVEDSSVPNDYFNIPSGYQIINWSDMIKGAKVEYH